VGRPATPAAWGGRRERRTGGRAREAQGRRKGGAREAQEGRTEHRGDAARELLAREVQQRPRLLRRGRGAWGRRRGVYSHSPLAKGAQGGRKGGAQAPHLHIPAEVWAWLFGRPTVLARVCAAAEREARVRCQHPRSRVPRYLPGAAHRTVTDPLLIRRWTLNRYGPVTARVHTECRLSETGAQARRVSHTVLIGHATLLPRTNRTRHVTPTHYSDTPRTGAQRRRGMGMGRDVSG
jgi:hypothetical protein